MQRQRWTWRRGAGHSGGGGGRRAVEVRGGWFRNQRKKGTRHAWRWMRLLLRWGRRRSGGDSGDLVGTAAIWSEEEGWGMGAAALVGVSVKETLSLLGFANL